MSVLDEHYLDQLYSAEQVRALDRIAIVELGIDNYTLMQRAAAFSYQVLMQVWPSAEAIVIVCGAGNNAGDGYVLARLALKDSKKVSVINLFDPVKLKGDAKLAYQELIATDFTPSKFSGDKLQQADVVVDAILGTGIDRELSGDCKSAVEEINAASANVLALDVPTGLNADTGQVMGAAVKATVTATFVGLKRGLFTADGPDYSGQVKFDNLAVPVAAYQKLGGQVVQCLRAEKLNHLLKPRLKNSHKGAFGHVLVIGGDHGYLGAARMAAEAAIRVGAGLTSIATRASHASMLSIVRPEIMSHGVETVAELQPLLKRANVIAIGPGLGQSAWAKLLLAYALESTLPIVIDADALTLLTADNKVSTQWVLTPHPGEAARLLGVTTAAIQQDRFAALKLLHKKYQGPVVLKGCGTLVATTDGEVYLNDNGNPGMGSGGMGDVLTGVIAGLIAQNIDINCATQLGVLMHSQAADKAASNSAERGLLALDLMPYLHQLANP